MDPSEIEHLCREAAARQHGLITFRQALAFGMSKSAIDRRVKRGAWRRLLPGVYAYAGTVSSPLQKLMAACLWAGPGAAVSHLAAARLLLPGFLELPVEISTSRNIRPRHGVALHRCKRLDQDSISRVSGLPVTSCARTLLDVSNRVPPMKVESALDYALDRRLTTVDHLRWMLINCGGRGVNGSALLRKMVGARDASGGVKPSELERLLRALIKRARLPRPEYEYEVSDGRRRAFVDAAYPHLKLGIEADGYKWHWKERWESDLHRRNFLESQGWHILHFTWWDVVYRPDYVAETIRRTLAQLMDKKVG